MLVGNAEQSHSSRSHVASERVAACPGDTIAVSCPKEASQWSTDIQPLPLEVEALPGEAEQLRGLVQPAVGH